MKKQKKRKAHASRSKAAGQPLPLDVSRRLPPQTSGTSRPRHRPDRPVRWERAYAANATRSLIRFWGALAARLSRHRTDVAMLSLPALLTILSIAVAQWTATARLPVSPPPSARHALYGLPHTPSPVAPVRADPSTAPEQRPAEQVLAEVPPTPATTDPPALDWPAARTPADETAVAPNPAGSIAEAKPDDARTEDVEHTLAAVQLDPAPEDTLKPSTGTAEATKLVIPGFDSPPPEPPAQELAMLDVPGGLESLNGVAAQCAFIPKPAQTPLPISWKTGDPESFGLALAAAARRQLEEFVIYNDRYTRLKYPMGDIHPMYGVCTDVIIRAYRVLGIDLQELVQTTRTGSGDPNIDHRRVDTLRKFFSRFGESLPISTFAEDYRPGDIVTYWRPQNRHSRTHIAIVSDETSASGRPLIIHNRGWGPQQEDGLFVDEITGHYRFSGLKKPGTEPAIQNTGVKTDASPAETSSLRDVVKTNR